MLPLLRPVILLENSLQARVTNKELVAFNQDAINDRICLFTIRT